MKNEYFPFEEDFEEKSNIEPGIIYVPYTFENKIEKNELSSSQRQQATITKPMGIDDIEYFHKKLRYASKIPKSRYGKIRINNEK